MLPTNPGRLSRKHLILVPGFAGFDALGQLLYYPGVTDVFGDWQNAAGAGDTSIDYFDNFPTGSVSLRAERLRSFLAKKLARGHIAAHDEVALLGHSTGGLDVRRLLVDLRENAEGTTSVDGQLLVSHESIRSCIKRVVFMSVPHFGTNIADYCMRFDDTLQSIVRDAATALQLNREPVGKLRRWLPELDSSSHLLLALFDALRESDTALAPSNADKANERDARAELVLWLEHMSKDVSSLGDLRSYRAGLAGPLASPAHYDVAQRQAELDELAERGVRTLSFVTRAPATGSAVLSYGLAASKFLAGLIELRSRAFNAASDLWFLPLVAGATGATRFLLDSGPLGAALLALHENPSLLFELAHAACADPTGPFIDPAEIAPTMIAPELTDGITGERLEPRMFQPRDNDGIVNSQSMMWPYDIRAPERHAFRYIECDHGDIIGHFELARAPKPKLGQRCHFAYDLLQRSAPSAEANRRPFERADFERVWRGVFDFAFGRA